MKQFCNGKNLKSDKKENWRIQQKNENLGKMEIIIYVRYSKETFKKKTIKRENKKEKSDEDEEDSTID